ncbi:MAG: hypothetical protein K2N06_02575 [Oscillospiraceae bacterium]|nr:hypothetical protein [Oscillospiraceae bacterium]
MTQEAILRKIEELNEADNTREIVEFIESLSDGEKTPVVLCELARAYNNLAAFENPNNTDTELLKKSVSIMESIENQFPENNHLLNYRMGYALFYLDRVGEALERFQTALIQRPDDADTKEFIKRCLDRLTLPVFDKNFSQRVNDGWKKFAAGEEKLRRLISENADSDEITGYCHELLSETFTDCCFEIGFNGEKYDLILSPEEDKYMLYLFDKFKRHASESVKEHWNIILGRQPSNKNSELAFDGKKFSLSDVSVRIEQEDRNCTVIGYCEKLTDLFNVNKNKALWCFDLLLDMTLGEIVNMRYVDSIDLTDKPFDSDDAIPLVRLRDIMKERFGENEDWDSAERFLDTITEYELKPHEFAEDEYPTPRLDAFYFFSSIPLLMFEYMNNDHYTINKADNDGVAAGFLFFPVHVFEDDENANRGKKILDFREELQRYIENKAGDSCVFIGGAFGLDNCYLDFLAWDIRKVLNAAVDFFAAQNTVPWAFYQSYRTDVQVLSLMDREEE